MERIRTTELAAYSGKTVILQGWLHRLRTLSHVSFLVLRDGRGTAQVVIEQAAAAAEATQITLESALEIRGTVVANPQAPGGYEIHHPTITVLSAALENPPFDLFRPTIKAQLPTQLDHAAIALRHPKRRAIFRISAAAVEGFRRHLRTHDFVEIQTPKIIGAASEGGANVFALDYFGKPAYLAQSPQLYKQMMVGVFERVFEVGPAFRAEPHDTPRHTNAFTSLDVEQGFSDHYAVMQTLNHTLQAMTAQIGAECAPELALLGISLPEVPAQIPQVHFREALQIAGALLGQDLSNEPDLAPAHERVLGEWAQREHNSEFVFIVGYPTAQRAFYTAPEPSEPYHSRGFDLLFRGLELVSGAQRLHRYEDYVATMHERGMNPASFAGYLDAFRHGMPPHGGFAIGLERFVSRIAGIANIREATLFPRDLQRLMP